MTDAQLERTTIDVSVSGRQEMFVATGEIVTFDGFLKVYMEGTDDESQGADIVMLPQLAKGESMIAEEVVATQRFTQQPIRYTEASLVRRLEELGIGRPSTYAPTISTIQAREYVQKGEKKGEKREYEILTLKKGKITSRKKSEMVGAEKGKLMPTDIGMVVNDFLMEYFPDIMDYNFTAQVESNFDEIAAGRERWNDEISKFYSGFHTNVENVSTLRLEHKVGERMLGTDPATGKPVSVKIGRFGPLVQLGSSDDSEKPRFASLLKNQSVSSLTLEEALKLFELPRELGEVDGEIMTVAVGRFGPYVKHGKNYVSIPKDIAPLEITLEQAVQLFEDKKKADAQKVIKTFAEEPGLQVLNGRYGPYISYNNQNYKIPRKTDPATLTLDECKAIIEAGPAPKSNSRRTRARKQQ
jgi:DNA topoisomerase-1